jgi:predicted DNA-binding transcriptional regulator AlpA
MDKDCFSIAEFCERNGISRAFFYIMQRGGTGPRLMRVGSTRVLISREAAAEWRREHETRVVQKTDAVPKPDGNWSNATKQND